MVKASISNTTNATNNAYLFIALAPKLEE
jgi:hypothetical protein